MQLFQLVIALLLGGAVLTALAYRIGAPYPALLALAGTVLALIPPEVPFANLDPDLAMVLFVAPALLDAAFDASPRDLGENWLPVANLVLCAVGLTVAAVAGVAHWLVPGMSWAAAVALGAIVAPPDAVAATSILRRLSPPHRLLVVLEGEGLLNDASALLIYRLAVGVALGATLSPATALPLLLANLFGSLLLGFVLARLYLVLTRRITDLAISVVTQFVGTFAVWIIADHAGVSPVLTMVAYAVTLARLVPHRQTAENRIGSYAVWDVTVFVLNALAFILVGLQLQEIVKTLDRSVGATLAFDLAILVTVIVVRLVWVMTYPLSAQLRRLVLRPKPGRTATLPTFRNAFVVGWSGMRGLLTLATALALPDGHHGGVAFPYRDLMITAAYAVVLGTLVLQGLTLGPLLGWLKLDDDGRVERERVFARQEAAREALAVLARSSEPEARLLAKDYALLLDHEPSAAGLRPQVLGALRLEAIGAQRAALRRLRQCRTIGDDAFHAIEEEFDWAEGHARRRLRLAAKAQS